MKKTFLSKALIAIAACSVFFSATAANAEAGKWRKTGFHFLGLYQYCYTAYPYDCMWLRP
ncbi:MULTISPECIES: hypothetical protein [Actinobacillus]|uniref:Uncharacterized protein n=2 Tax=Actinobacillus TaxID=713 RepID=A0ABN5MK68_ACTPL|nr:MULTISPECIES: hypothetical protein [Actinobacillus]ASU15425.1 hypothetical protein CHY23_00649 [Actinobacillus pleuropneumoniae]AWG96003.1 hypothetical protein APPSER1_08680 [Actinobacillus pleuropneumoniae serovar 1 str. 4074]AXA22073.1 hypothetical protein DRF63_08675 [Actinobacillus pleuropneumoniae]MBL4536462.1 hypothetical protein [Actinobacillus pleuropneumoniae]MCO4167766.1 hypothetical protein [Actinobacillus suis]